MNKQFSMPTFNNGLSFNSNNRELMQHNSNQINSDKHIIDHRDVNANNMHLTRYTQDIINPIKREYLKQVISIDSLFRDMPETSETADFIYTLQEPMRNVVSMKLCSLELPNIWYTFSSKKRNNIFKIHMRNVSNGSGYFYNKTYYIEIPDGNYSVLEFEKYMNYSFRNRENGGGLDFLRVNIDPITGSTIFRAHDSTDPDIGNSPSPYDPSSNYYSPNLYFELDFVLEDEPDRPLYKNCGWMLGFKEEFYQVYNTDTYTDISTFANISVTYKNYIKSEKIFGSGISTYILMVVDDFNNNYKDSVYSGCGDCYLHDSILARIPVVSGSNSLMFNNASDLIFKQRDYFGPVTIDRIKIQLIDKFGEVLDLNNNNFSFSLEFTQLYS